MRALVIAEGVLLALGIFLVRHGANVGVIGLLCGIPVVVWAIAEADEQGHSAVAGFLVYLLLCMVGACGSMLS